MVADQGTFRTSPVHVAMKVNVLLPRPRVRGDVISHTELPFGTRLVEAFHPGHHGHSHKSKIYVPL